MSYVLRLVLTGLVLMVAVCPPAGAANAASSPLLKSDAPSAPTTTVTTTTAISTTDISTTTSTIHGACLSIASGWNLVGTGEGGTLDVAMAFGDPSKVEVVWKWVPDQKSWAFYAPALNAQGGTALADYAANIGFDVLGTIGPGEGFWVKATQPLSVGWTTGGEIQSTAFQDGQPGALPPGWNLISIANPRTPSEFNADIGASPAPAGVVPNNIISLWAWDILLGKWYYYAPTLEAQGGTALSDYTTSKGYLDFTENNKVLHNGIGFWVNKP